MANQSVTLEDLIREDEREHVSKTQCQKDWELLGAQADRLNPLREESPVNYADYAAIYDRKNEMQQDFQLTERRAQGSELAAMLKRFPEHSEWILAHKQLWADEPEQRPVMQAVNGHIKVTKQGVKYVPGYMRMVGFEEPAEPINGPVWAKADGWRLWPRMGALPRLGFGAMLLVGMVRKRAVTKPSSFHVLINEIPDLDYRTKSRLWDFFHRVMHKVDPNAYKAWVTRRKAK